MLNKQLREFYERWEKKIKNIQIEDIQNHSDSELSVLFDKFINLYIVYNAIYYEASVCLAYSKIKEVKSLLKNPNFHIEKIAFEGSLEEQAIDNVVEFFSISDTFESLLEEKEFKEAVKALQSLLNNKEFSIYSHRIYDSKPKDAKSLDEALKNNIHSQDSEEKAKAILNFIYRIRCNIFHGEKAFDPIQIRILKPLVTILGKIVEELYSKLSNKQHPLYMTDSDYSKYLDIKNRILVEKQNKKDEKNFQLKQKEIINQVLHD